MIFVWSALNTIQSLRLFDELASQLESSQATLIHQRSADHAGTFLRRRKSVRIDVIQYTHTELRDRIPTHRFQFFLGSAAVSAQLACVCPYAFAVGRRHQHLNAYKASRATLGAILPYTILHRHGEFPDPFRFNLSLASFK
jgi:hypothetical protein